MDEFKNQSSVVPGGWCCPCCWHSRGKDRAKIRRVSRRRLKQKDLKEFEQEKVQ